MKTKPPTFIGFDYSLSSPAMCIISPKYTFVSYNTKAKKVCKKWKIGNDFFIQGFLQPDYSNNQERWNNLTIPFMKIIKKLDQENLVVGIEGYAFGGKGQVFNIAEATQTLKYRLFHEHNLECEQFPPPTIKKFATGNGRAKKEEMYKQFEDDTSISLTSICKNVGASPVSDIVDSYFVAKKVQHFSKIIS